jgi:hypothetical protein
MGAELGFTGEAVESISRLAVGRRPAGIPFSRYRVSLRLQLASASVGLELVPGNFRGVLTISLGVDIVMTLETALS